MTRTDSSHFVRELKLALGLCAVALDRELAGAHAPDSGAESPARPVATGLATDNLSAADLGAIAVFVGRVARASRHHEIRHLCRVLAEKAEQCRAPASPRADADPAP